jgi:hypothetical protein
MDDGSYRITIGVGDPSTGEIPPPPLLPERFWRINAITGGVGKDCPIPGTDTNGTAVPLIEWASSLLQARQYLDGKLDPASPRSVVDGRVTFDETVPPMTKVTVTWHLAHEGPIVLPHN